MVSRRKLPKRSQAHVIGEQAVRAVKDALPPEWIVRDQPVSDYGIDLEIELAKGVVSGRIFKAQVKGHGSIEWTQDGTFLQVVSETALNYWRQFRVPVVLFVVDVSPGDVCWSRTQELSASRSTSHIRVHRANSLPLTINALSWYVVNWIDLQTARQALYSVALLSQRLERRLAEMDCDCFMAMEPDDVEETRDLYEQIVRFAQAAGVNVTQILPWDLWIARSGRTWGDEESLAFGTHDEAVLYMKNLFEEALESATAMIDAEEATPDNARAKAFIQYKARGVHIEWRFENRFQRLGSQAWAKVEKQLRARGALKFPLRAQ